MVITWGAALSIWQVTVALGVPSILNTTLVVVPLLKLLGVAFTAVTLALSFTVYLNTLEYLVPVAVPHTAALVSYFTR